MAVQRPFADVHADTLATIRRMKMRRIVVVAEDGNRDAEAATDDGHGSNLAPKPGAKHGGRRVHVRTTPHVQLRANEIFASEASVP